MGVEICFDDYLESVVANCHESLRLYTLMDDDCEQSQPDFFELKMQVVQPQPENKKRSEQEANKKDQNAEPPIPVLEICKYAQEHVLLMGKAGSGKSTALQQVLLNKAQESQRNSEALIPVLVKLRSWQSFPSVIALIQDVLETGIQRRLDEETIIDLLFTDRLLLLIDGVNELPSYFQDRNPSHDVEAFRKKYRKTPMIFTTRVLGVSRNLGIAKQMEMLALSDREMRQFIERCLPQQSEQMLNRLGDDRRRRLGETPLLLSMLCDISRQREDGLPANLGSPFRAFADSYDHKIQENIPVDDKYKRWVFDLLQQLAFAMMPQNDPHGLQQDIHKFEAEKILVNLLYDESRDYAKQCLENLLKYHLIQYKTDQTIEFCHQSIQEYYAAEYLWRQLEGLNDKKLQKSCLNYWDWTESLVLMLDFEDREDQAVRLVRLALEVDLQLGARLAGAVKDEWQELTIGYVNQIEIPWLLKIYYLKLTRSQKAIPILTQLLAHENHDIRKCAAESIKEIVDESSLPLLIKAMQKADSHTCWMIADALGRVGNDTSCQVLVSCIESRDENIRRSAAYALSKIRSDLTIRCLIQLLKHRDPNVRGSAAEALREIDTKPVIDSLILALEDESASVRAYAASSLGEIADNSAVLPLIKSLEEDEDTIVRTRVSEALGKIGNKFAIPSLLKALNDEASDAYNSAGKALVKICNKSSIPSLMESLKHINPNVREKVAYVLGKIGDKNLCDALVEIALRDETCAVRISAINSLGEIACKSSVPVLIEFLKDKEQFIRMYAAEALGKISSEIAIPALIEAIDFEYNLSFGCSPHAAVALSKINLEVSIPYLVKVLEGNDHMRLQVLIDHSKLKDGRIIQSLINLVKNIQNSNLFSFSYSDQGFFAKTLGEIGGKEVLPYLIESLEYTLCLYKEINNFIQEADQNPNNNNIQLVEQLKFKRTELDHFFICVAPVIGEIGSEHTIALLIKILQFEDTFAKHFIISTLSKIATPTLLSYLYNLSLRFSQPSEVLSAISNIQARCKYYNYNIAQTPLQETENHANPVEKILQEIHQTLKTMSETGKYNINAESVQIIEKNYGEVIAKKYANDPALLQTINEITQVLANLQKTHPTATEAEAKDIIETEFKEFQNNQPTKWTTFRQQLLNPERWLNGGKATISEIAKHYAENSVFLKAGVAFLDGFSADEE